MKYWLRTSQKLYAKFFFIARTCYCNFFLMTSHFLFKGKVSQVSSAAVKDYLQYRCTLANKIVIFAHIITNLQKPFRSSTHWGTVHNCGQGEGEGGGALRHIILWFSDIAMDKRGRLEFFLMFLSSVQCVLLHA
jgi:hypothetical protein